MDIEIDKYVLKPNGFGSYDLFERVISINQKTNKGYNNLTNYGYGLSIEKCVEKIIYKNLADKEATVPFKVFLESYKQERNKIKNLVQVELHT